MPIFLPGPGPLEQSPHSPDTATVAPDAWAFVVRSRPVAYYRGSYSAFSGAADEPVPSDNTNWASVARSRQVKPYQGSAPYVVLVPPVVPGVYAPPLVVDLSPPGLYRAPASRVVPAYDQPAAAAGVDYAALVTSRITSYYRGAPSSFMGAADEPLAATSVYAAVVQSADVSFYEGSASRVINSADEPFPDDWVPGVRSRLVQPYSARPSLIVPAYDQPAAAIQNWVQLVTSSEPRAYAPPRSLFIPAYFDTASVVANLVTQTIQRRGLYSAPLSRVIVAPDTPPPAQGVAFVTQSRGTLADVAALSRVFLPVSDVAIITPGPNMGGGGEWIIWTKPYFPGNDPANWRRFPKPYFRKPTRRVP